MTNDTARAQVVLFSGDTWTWDGTDWTQRAGGSLARLSPGKGPPGTQVSVSGWGFLAHEKVRLAFIDSVVGKIVLTKVRADKTGALTVQVTIPSGATLGGSA